MSSEAERTDRPPVGLGWLWLLWRKVITIPRREADARMEEALADRGGRGALDRKVVIVLVTTALCLTFLEYVGMSNRWRDAAALADTLGFPGLHDWLHATMGSSQDARINRLTWWGIGCFVAYFVIPVFVIRVVLREKLSDYGLRAGDAFRDGWIYAVFFAVMIPILWIVSLDPHFQEQYPFWRPGPGEGLWPHFYRWQFLYLLQFFALEFFFRGFMVHGLKDRMGFQAVLVMMVPYCMIHFGKPMAETIGAIIAGIALGALSLKNRSIWMGVVIHCAVALSMDLLSLWRTGHLGSWG
ncbi:MAG: CPBP family intramembrane metalloprotease [Deltaproteobacteria bacterium]|nr:MAG: CPBP family intramembrane metalloprotease [Deltaproteobacteria bacterium]